MICLDYNAAFDSVVQDQLIDNIAIKFGVKENALEPLDYYFSDCFFTMTLNDIKSKKRIIGYLDCSMFISMIDMVLTKKKELKHILQKT